MKQIDRLLEKARSTRPEGKTVIVIEYPDGRKTDPVIRDVDHVIRVIPASRLMQLS